MARKLSLRHRAQEFLADRFSFVQYPDIRAGDEASKLALPFRFANRMPWYTRIALAAVGLFTAVFFTGLALLGLYVLKAFIAGMIDG